MSTTCQVTIPGMEDTRADETEKAPTLMELTFQLCVWVVGNKHLKNEKI